MNIQEKTIIGVSELLIFEETNILMNVWSQIRFFYQLFVSQLGTKFQEWLPDSIKVWLLKLLGFYGNIF